MHKGSGQLTLGMNPHQGQHSTKIALCMQAQLCLFCVHDRANRSYAATCHELRGQDSANAAGSRRAWVQNALRCHHQHNKRLCALFSIRPRIHMIQQRRTVPLVTLPAPPRLRAPEQFSDTSNCHQPATAARHYPVGVRYSLVHPLTPWVAPNVLGHATIRGTWFDNVIHAAVQGVVHQCSKRTHRQWLELALKIIRLHDANDFVPKLCRQRRARKHASGWARLAH